MNLFNFSTVFTPRPVLSWREWVLAAVFFLVGVGLFVRHDDFPSFYHPDEPSKARQVIDGDYNFNHPMLLLQATRIIVAMEHRALTPQPVTEAGRLASAIFAAGAVSFLVLLAAHLRGFWAGAFAGGLLLANAQLYELAHYMKEDPALVFGMAAFFLALVRCSLAPSFSRFALMGAAAGLALSGKYIGALVIPLGFFPIWCSGGRRWRHAAIYLGSLALIFVLINFPMLSSLGVLGGSVGREMDYVVHGNKGLGRSVPHGVYGAVFRTTVNPVLWGLLVLYYLGLWIRRRTISIAEIVVALFPIFFVILLSFSPKTHHRYFLPDTLLFCTLAALGLFHLRLRWLQVAVALAALLVSGWKWAIMDQAFQNDARRLLVAFIAQHVPKDAVIVQDKRVNLPNPQDPRQSDSPYFPSQPLRGKLFAADEGTIEELRAQGVQYVAVAEGDYGRFFLEDRSVRAAEKADYDRRRKFYETLFREGEIIWQCEAGPQQYLQPAIKLYRLPPGQPQAKDSSN